MPEESVKMFERINAFRRKLESGRTCLGPAISFSDPAVSEALAPVSDFLWIDLEHTAIGFDSLMSHLIAARAGGAPALVRIPIADVGYVKRVLDSGADGIIVPQIQSAAEVRAMVAACRYPPLGCRGYGPRRPSHYGRDGGAEYVERANASIFVTAQIETASALADLDAIVAIPGLDSLVIGPYDLSGSMGRLGQLTHPEGLAAIETIVRKARAAGKFVGAGVGSSEEFALQVAALGVQWLQYGGDYTYMVEHADATFAGLRRRFSQ